MDFYLYLIRRITECYFIANIMMGKNNQEDEEQDAVGKVYLRFQEFQNITDEAFFDYFERLVDSLVKSNIPALFQNFHQNQY